MKKLLEIICIFIITMLGGSVFFAIKYGIEFRIILFIIGCFIAFFNIKNRNANIIPLYFIILILIFNTFINIDKGIKFDSFIALSIVCFALAFIQDFIKKEMFIDIYIKIMIIISCVSLIIYIVSIFKDPMSLPLYKKENLDGIVYQYSIYYTWGWKTFFEERNAGIYWEPGAFQLYLNLALMFIIFAKNNINNKICVAPLFIITIITTKSTTGYIILAAIIMYSIMTKRIKVKSRNMKIIGTALILIISIISIAFLLKSDVISKKFENTEHKSSYSIRRNDAFGTFDIITKYPINGVGIFSDVKYKEEGARGITNNSNGMLEFVEIFGIPIAVLYFARIYMGIRSCFTLKNHMDSIFIFCIFMTIFFTEGVILRAVFMTFLFKWKEEKR